MPYTCVFLSLDLIFEVSNHLLIKEWLFFGHELIGTSPVDSCSDLREFCALSAREEQDVRSVFFFCIFTHRFVCTQIWKLEGMDSVFYNFLC